MNGALPRMRTIQEAYDELKHLDPKTAVTKYYIRELALTEAIPIRMAGRKRLLNLDALLEYLNGQKGSSKDG